MIFSYRSTLVDHASGKAKNLITPIDTEKWLDRVRDNPLGLYGNSAQLIEEHVLATLQAGDVMMVAAIVSKLDDEWRGKNNCIIFELAMFVYAGFKAGQYTAETWAAVLAVAWQSGSRGMLATVKLSQAQVIEMFKAAPMHVLHKIVSHDGLVVQAEYDALGDTLDVARGVSTGIDHYEDGFSWTTDAEEVIKFAALNCQTKKEIPGFIHATVPKTAVLAMFSFENEVIIDPTVKKIKVVKHFLRGSELRNFHANVDVEANTRDVLFKTGYHTSRMAAAEAEAEDDDEFERSTPELRGPKNIFER